MLAEPTRKFSGSNAGSMGSIDGLILVDFHYASLPLALAPGPSRLLWFVFGAASASWFIKSKDTQQWRATHCPRRQVTQEGYVQPAAPVQPNTPTPPPAPAPVAETPRAEPPPPQYPTAPREQQSRPWGWGHGWNSSWEQRQDSGAATPPFPTERWDEEKKRMQDFGKQAHETFVDFSESTLNSLASTVENLKAKLAEQRALREEQAKQMEAMKAEQQRQFEEWKRQQPPRHIV
ncbi:hypothetical protein NLI96_g10760 [Meripilus lineatus]|uniref:Uncharacterized protein n=1 Tax=Meripilus lineatus TaxID=2056292 RepID=A0AAD5YDX7_9APHY|nr:hypothetical protein NLI96_g10760 [Physisporinus lineatus]